jgi:hypothetical protein
MVLRTGLIIAKKAFLLKKTVHTYEQFSTPVVYSMIRLRIKML